MTEQIDNDIEELPSEMRIDNALEIEFFGTHEAQDKLFSELALAQGEFGSALADTTGQDGHRTFRYADMASLVRASRPALTKHRIAITQWPLGGDGTLLTIVAGHGARIQSVFRFRRADATVAGVPGIKLTGSSLTYFSRYVMRSILGLPGDDDLDSQAQPERPRGNPPAPPKQQPKPQPKPAPKAADPTPPVVMSEQSDNGETTTIDTTGETIPDDIDGPNGEAVPESDPHPEFNDPSPRKEETQKLIVKTMAALFSESGTGKDVPLPIKSRIVREATGREPSKDHPYTEGECQRIVAFLYDTARELGIDPDAPQSKADVKKSTRGFERRLGLAQ